MSQNTALVTGGSGFLGRQVVATFNKNGWTAKGTGLSRADGNKILKVNLENAAAVEKVISDVKPIVIVHCAANRFPDKVDNDPEGTRKLNIEASRTLARLAAANKALLIYISTDYVFSGKEGEAPYEVDARPAPPNLYGQTKLDGEKLVIEEFKRAGCPEKAIVLRIPVLYGDAEKPEESAVNVLMDKVMKSQDLKGEDRIKMDNWSIRYPTNTEDVARVCFDIGNKYLGSSAQSSLPQILQFSSEDRFTKYEMCQLFAEIMGVSCAGIEPEVRPSGDSNGAVARPYDCHLSTKSLREAGISVSTQDFVAWWRWRVGAMRR